MYHKKMLLVAVSVMICVSVSGCVEVGFASKGHFAWGVPETNLFDKVKIGNSQLPSQEVVNDGAAIAVAKNGSNRQSGTQFAKFEGRK